MRLKCGKVERESFQGGVDVDAVRNKKSGGSVGAEARKIRKILERMQQNSKVHMSLLSHRAASLPKPCSEHAVFNSVFLTQLEPSAAKRRKDADVRTFDS